MPVEYEVVKFEILAFGKVVGCIEKMDSISGPWRASIQVNQVEDFFDLLFGYGNTPNAALENLFARQRGIVAELDRLQPHLLPASEPEAEDTEIAFCADIRLSRNAAAM